VLAVEFGKAVRSLSPALSAEGDAPIAAFETKNDSAAAAASAAAAGSAAADPSLERYRAGAGSAYHRYSCPILSATPKRTLLASGDIKRLNLVACKTCRRL
jgi:hypothetical protein